MTKLPLILLFAAGLGLGVVAYQPVDAWGAGEKKTTQKKAHAHARGKQCRYTCPKGLYVCPDDQPGDDGCFDYTCTKGRIGSDSCP